MKRLYVLALIFGCIACRQEDAPAKQVAKKAEEIVAPAPMPEAQGRFAPRDTCERVAGADEFRDLIAAAVRARHTDAFVALVASDIKLDFGDGAGAEELRERLDDPSRNLWGKLDELMELGCSANRQGGITIPWFFDQNLGGADPFATMLVTGESVPAFAAPDPASEPVGSVSWDLVKIATLEPDRPYQQVELPDGATGFIETGRLRSVIDYRLIASRRNDRWRITSFVRGD